MGSCQLESTDAPTQQPELLMDEVRMDTPPHMESDQLDGRSADGYTPPHMESDQLESSRNLDPVAGATDGSPTQQQELLMDEKVEPPPP